jgi:hypothetical protein
VHKFLCIHTKIYPQSAFDTNSQMLSRLFVHSQIMCSQFLVLFCVFQQIDLFLIPS